MLMINWTGVGRVYWWPFFNSFEYKGLWSVECRFLWFQVVLCSVLMGRAFINKLNSNNSVN